MRNYIKVSQREGSCQKGCVLSSSCSGYPSTHTFYYNERRAIIFLHKSEFHERRESKRCGPVSHTAQAKRVEYCRLTHFHGLWSS